MQNKYRFLSQDEFGKPCHRHQLLVDDKWTDMTGGSSIVDVLKKDGLTYWAAGLAVKTFSNIEDGKLLTKIKNGKATDAEILLVQESVKKWQREHEDLPEDAYIQLCIEAYFAHTVKLDDSAGKGTELHAFLEEYVKFCMEKGGKPQPYKGEDIRVKEFSDWALKDIKRFIWSEAHMFNEDLFIGGISDVGAQMNDDTFAIIDFKSSKEAYFSHFVQGFIYNLLLEKNGLFDENGIQLLPKIEKPVNKIIIIPFGAKEFTVHENSNVDGLRKAALSCITLYREKCNFEKK